jgi:hypothetical protein
MTPLNLSTLSDLRPGDYAIMLRFLTDERAATSIEQAPAPSANPLARPRHASI